MVGYRRFEGVEAAELQAELYRSARLFVNFFQPSFKLLAKQRDGARVRKTYSAPATPHQRLAADARTPDAVRHHLQEIYAALDPVALLRDIRDVQERLGPAQGRTVFFLKLRPSRRRKVHTAWCETFTPRAASSSFSPCSVRCGVCLIRSTMNVRCGSRTGFTVTAHLARCHRTRRAIALPPLHNGRHCNIEPGRHSMATLAGLHRLYGSFTKIIRKGGGPSDAGLRSSQHLES